MVKFDFHTVNWVTLSTLATVAGVLTALFLPICRDRRPKKELATNLRQRLLASLTILRPILARRFRDTPLGKKTSDSFDEKEATHIGKIDQVFPLIHNLKSRESNLILTIWLNLTAMQALPSITPETATNVLRMIDAAIEMLSSNKYLRGRKPKPFFANDFRVDDSN
jgi:hypothetical protein